jgi:hypothetical protein
VHRKLSGYTVTDVCAVLSFPSCSVVGCLHWHCCQHNRGWCVCSALLPGIITTVPGAYPATDNVLSSNSSSNAKAGRLVQIGLILAVRCLQDPPPPQPYAAICMCDCYLHCHPCCCRRRRSSSSSKDGSAGSSRAYKTQHMAGRRTNFQQCLVSEVQVQPFIEVPSCSHYVTFCCCCCCHCCCRAMAS